MAVHVGSQCPVPGEADLESSRVVADLPVLAPSTFGFFVGRSSAKVSLSAAALRLAARLSLLDGLTTCPPLAFCLKTHCDAEAGRLRESNSTGRDPSTASKYCIDLMPCAVVRIVLLHGMCGSYFDSLG